MSISKQAEQIREISGVNPYKCMKCGKYRSRGDGEQNASVGKRQENDDFADSVYELFGKTADLCIFYQRIFPGVWSTSDVCFVSDRNCDWNPGCAVVSENTVPWRCGSVCQFLHPSSIP